MARRASSSTNPVLIIVIVVGVIAAVFGGKILMTKKSETFSDVNPLVIQDLLDNGNSLRNNEYLIEGKIDERYFRDNNPSSIVTVRVKTDAGDEIVFVKVPEKFNNMNMEREQRYAFKVKFEQGGIPVATNINRL
ncbi:hypothetical protein HZ994_17705 [Akkermansiaceae bacterium]|nr:hypothetical protein HZ994_17705 [Akkermansiaceae bacterium]